VTGFADREAVMDVVATLARGHGYCSVVWENLETDAR
jgi:hypothetical protein